MFSDFIFKYKLPKQFKECYVNMFTKVFTVLIMYLSSIKSIKKNINILIL